MNKKIYINLVLILLCGSLIAQVDRSKMPEPGPAPKIDLGETQSFTLDNGLKVFVVENHKLPKVSFALQFDVDPLLEGDKTGAADMAGDMMSKGTTNRTKDELNFSVDFIGASFSTSSSFVFGSSLKKHTVKLLEIMSDAVKNSDFKSEELEKLRTQYISGKQTEKDDPDAIAGNIRRVLLYGKNHPYGELTTEETLKNITLKDVKAYYSTYIKPNVAYLAVVGDIDVKEAKTLVEKYFGDWEKGEVPTHIYEMPAAPKTMQVVMVNKPGAVQSVIATFNTIDLKPGSENAIKSAITNGVLGGGFTSKLNLNLREAHSYTYGARSSISSDELIGNFNASAKVRNEVTDSALVEMMKEIMNMRNGNVTADELETIKNYRTGTFAIGLENAQTKARYAINIEKYGLDKQYYANYLKNVAAVSLEDVNAISKKYINPMNGYVLVVGNQEEVAEKVKSFSPSGNIIYLDVDGNPAAAESFKKAPAGMTAEKVISKNIEAIGGMKAISKVKSMKMEMGFSTQGMAFGITVISEAPNKQVTEVLMNGNVMEKTIFNGKEGVSTGMRGKTIFDEERNAQTAVESFMFPEIEYLKEAYKVELLGVGNKNDEDVYAVKIIKPTSDVMTNYYSIATGLLVMSEAIIEGSLAESLYSDYTEVKKIKVPYTILRDMGPQKVEVKVKKVTVNTKLEAGTFDLPK
ncbi:MAG: insulinase family protein [Flavobacteriales bacterium]|nr:insulinase family protein [Flavobacteriales bacterium]